MDPNFQLFEYLEDGVIIISRDGIIEDINHSALEIFKYSYEELVGKSLNELMFEKDAKYHDFFIQRHILSGSKDPLRKGREVDGKDKNDQKIPLYVSVVKYIENEIKFIGFIRELKHQFFHDLSKFKSIFLVSNEYKISCDSNGNILDTNSFFSLLGYDLSDSNPKTIFEFVHKDDLEIILSIFRRINNNSEIHNEIIRIIKKDGKMIYFSWNSNILESRSQKYKETYYQHVTIANDITEVVRKDDQISIIENAMNENPNGILIANSDGLIEYVNDNFLNGLKLQKNEILKKNLFENSYYIDSEIKLDVFNLITNKGAWKGKININCGKEDKRTYFVTLEGIKSNINNVINYVEMVEDISIIESINNQVENEKNKMIQILENIPDGIILFDKNGNTLELNSSVNSIYWSFYNKNLKLLLMEKNLFSTNEENLFINTLKEFFYSKEYSKTIEPIKNIFLKILKITLESSLIFIFTDISNELKIEQFRNQLISTVSHELRTPISSVIQSLNNFIKYENRLSIEERKRIIQIAYSNSQLLAEIVDDLLLISQIDGDKLKLSKSNFNLSKLITEIIDQFDIKLQKKNMKINFNLISNINISADFKRIGQVIRIILDNAIKYSHNNSYIDINLTKNKELRTQKGISIEIKDYGIGILEKDIPSLFNRFYRGKNVINIKGTGLGLAIANELIHMHNGKIIIESKINEGSSFFIFLPYE